MRIHTKKQQQGSALVWLVSLTMIVGMLALVVDASMLYFEKRKLQSVANEVVSAIGDMNKACGYQGGNLKGQAQEYLASKYADSQITVDRANWVYVGSDQGKHTVLPLLDAQMDRSNGITLEISKPLSGFLYFIKGDSKLKAASTLKKEVVVAAGLSSNLLTLNTSESVLLNLIFGKILGQNISVATDLQAIAGTVTDLSGLVSNLGVGPVLNSIPLDKLLEAVFDATDIPLSATAGVADRLISALGINTNINLETVISGISKATLVPDNASINTLNLVQSIIFGIDDNLPKEISINSTDLLGPVGGALADVRIKLRIMPKPAYIVSPVIKIYDPGTNNYRYPYMGTSNIEAEVYLGTLSLGEVNLSELKLSLNLGDAFFEINEISNCALGSSNGIASISGNGKASLLRLNANIDIARIRDWSVVKACINPIAKGGNNKSFDSGYELSSDEFPIGYPFSTDSIIEVVFDLVEGLGVSALSSSCTPRKIQVFDSNILGLIVSPILETLVEPLKNILLLIESELLMPLIGSLGMQVAASNLSINGMTQQSIIIEGYFSE